MEFCMISSLMIWSVVWEESAVHKNTTTITNFSRISTSFHYRPSVNKWELTDVKKLAIGSVWLLGSSQSDRAFTPEYCGCQPQDPSWQPLSTAFRQGRCHRGIIALLLTPQTLSLAALNALHLLSIADANDQGSGEPVFLSNQPCKQG